MFIDSLLGSPDEFGHKDCHKMDDQGQPVTLMGAVTFKSLLGFPCPVKWRPGRFLFPENRRWPLLILLGAPIFCNVTVSSPPLFA